MTTHHPRTEWANVATCALSLMFPLSLILGALHDVMYLYIGTALYITITAADLVCRRIWNFHGWNEVDRQSTISKAAIAGYKIILGLHAALFVPTIFATTYGVMSKELSYLEYFVLVYLLSIHAVAALDNAHEYLHHGGRAKRLTAHLIFSIAAFEGFAIEHLYLHHARKHFLLKEDVEWSRYRQTIYQFILYSQLYGFKVIFHAEQERLASTGSSPYTLKNKAFWPFLFPLIWTTVMLAMFPASAVMVAMGGVYLGTLRFISRGYTGHYALKRGLDSTSGKPVAINLDLAWDRNDPFSKYIYFGGPRHALHHVTPDRKFWEYIRKKTTTVELPFCYEFMAVISLVPPVFFRVMDRAIAKLPPYVEVHDFHAMSGAYEPTAPAITFR